MIGRTHHSGPRLPAFSCVTTENLPGSRWHAPCQVQTHEGTPVEWMNYHHFLYFWVVAKEGSIVAASKRLFLAPPTISGQIHRFEEILGEKLFSHQGRHLELTEAGRVAFRYAEEIFSLGSEFLDTMKGRPKTDRPLRVVVGIADVVPASLVRRFLEPALELTG